MSHKSMGSHGSKPGFDCPTSRTTQPCFMVGKSMFQKSLAPRAHQIAWITIAFGALTTPLGPLNAQWAATYTQASLPATHNGSFRASYNSTDRLLHSFEFGRALVLESLWSNLLRGAQRQDDRLARTLVDDVFARPPRAPLDAVSGTQAFRKFAPEVQAVFDWTQAFRRQVYDVLADQSVPASARAGRIAELVAYYRARRDLALSVRPKNVGRLNAGTNALGFRRSYPSVNGVLWAAQWLEVGLFEPLLSAQTAPEQQRLLALTVDRFRRMLRDPGTTTPSLMPISAAVAPEFARAYPDVAAIMDNLHMLQDNVADIFLAREIPRSAKRQEIVRAAEFFRADTVGAIPYERWAASDALMGANNMGGLAVGFGAELPRPTVARGVSLATRADSIAVMGDMADMAMAEMDHAAMQQQPGAQQGDLRAIRERMMADPVIRERVATDPILQRMLAALPPGQAGQTAMPGMNMPGMNVPGMQHGGMPMPNMPMRDATMTPAVTTEERRVANDFIVRLLADPAVESRIHEMPELHRLWSDPDVQRRIQELRRATPSGQQTPARRPAPPPAHVHPPNASRP